MANTFALTSQVRQRAQFQGLFSDMWLIKASCTDTDAIALTDTLEVDFTVPGVVLGDMVLGVSFTLDLNDGTDSATVTAEVSAADTVTLHIVADAGEFAADAINTAVIKILVGRPTW